MIEIPYVLYRESLLTDSESAVIRSMPHSGTDLPAALPAGTVVFPRFRSLPYGEMLEAEVSEMGGRLVNSFSQYKYVSDVHAWKNDLKGLTPAVYSEADLPNLPEGEWFVKGETNSNKEHWLTACYAENTASLPNVINQLHNHPVIGNQKIIIRPFIHYHVLGTMANGQPVCNEWRVFILNGQIVGSGFYWAAQLDMITKPVSPLSNPSFNKTLEEVISRLSGKVPYMVVDLAERTDGTWDVIELNDANMSGLCDVDPEVLWTNISNVFN